LEGEKAKEKIVNELKALNYSELKEMINRICEKENMKVLKMLIDVLTKTDQLFID